MLKRIITWLISLWVLAYLVFLLINNVVLTSPAIRNYISYFLIAVVFIYIWYIYSIKPTYIKRHKLILACLWLFMIIYSHYMFTNDPASGIYYWDIFKIIWVILVFLSPTNLRISKKIQTEKEESELEIVEV